MVMKTGNIFWLRQEPKKSKGRPSVLILFRKYTLKNSSMSPTNFACMDLLLR